MSRSGVRRTGGRAAILLAALWVSPALAHGNRFSISTVSIAPDDPDAWWANANGWGVVRTDDAGATWAWRCEESIGTISVFDLLALDGGQAVLATADGLLRVGSGCGADPVDGLPAGAQATGLARGTSGYYSSIYLDGSGGLYRCDTDV